jgi:hypothetical protein
VIALVVVLFSPLANPTRRPERVSLDLAAQATSTTWMPTTTPPTTNRWPRARPPPTSCCRTTTVPGVSDEALSTILAGAIGR